jgi:hypothetical protein
MATYSQAFGMILCGGAMQKFMPKAIPRGTSPNGTGKVKRICWFLMSSWLAWNH